MDIIQKLTEELQVKKWQVEAAVKLIDEGNTIPFISRYRKEATGALNDEQLRDLGERLTYLRNLEDKKAQVISSIEEQGKLTEELKAAIEAAQTQVAVDDLYRPYRPKRRTRATMAKEKGLETRVYDDMKMLADSFSLEPGLRVALGNPILPAEEKLKLLTAAGGIEVSDLYERFMHLVLEHKRESLLLFMAHIYIHLYRKDKRITRVQFSTAVPVSEEVKVHLQNKLKEETGSTIEFSGIVQPELIGGFRLRIGNYRIDASYATQLRDIRSRLLENR